MTRSVTVLSALAVVSLAIPAGASAQLTRVSPDCDYIVGTTTVLSMFSPDAADCAGAFAGNNAQLTPQVLAEIIAQGWGTSPTYLGTTDAGLTSGPFSSVPGSSSGWINFDSPLTGDYVVALKASNQFSLYFFSGLVNQASIFYTTLGTSLNKQGSPQGLSHASLYEVRRVTVPEPESAMLLLTGLIGLGFVAARRRRETT